MLFFGVGSCVSARDLLDELDPPNLAFARHLVLSRKNADNDSAASQVPNEILLQIFDEFVLTELYQTRLTRHLSSSLPIQPGVELLSKVCRRWRLLALNTPSLWGIIYLKLKYPASSRNTPLAGKRYNWVRTYLSRCGDLPFDLLVDATDIIDAFPPLHEAIGILLHSTKRWKSLLLFSSKNMYAENFLASLRYMPFPIMRRVDCCCEEEPTYFYNFIKHGLVTPQLESLSLHNIAFYPSIVQWASLTSLEIRFGSWPAYSQLETIFSASSASRIQALHTLILHVSGSKFQSEVEKGTNPAFILPQVRHLELRGASRPSYNILQLFIFPFLEQLVIDGEPAQEVSDAILRLCRDARPATEGSCPCYPTLTHLTLSNVSGTFSPLDMSNIALTLPNITYLALHRVDAGPLLDILQHEDAEIPAAYAQSGRVCPKHPAIPTPGRFVVWPKLQTIEGRPWMLAPGSFGSLRAVHQVRSDGGMPLKFLVEDKASHQNWNRTRALSQPTLKPTSSSLSVSDAGKPEQRSWRFRLSSFSRAGGDSLDTP
ncbi:hypothetical protein BDN72DRAFT_834886 [Pluteus cervinus]|uniref:Uncharacterized protein n=1 Tax=Pluteus cervinus TaxID=181527 RepID=A0ACD3B5G6_9AGAR|nr:hypothetical protein BDN72DRAFT_834886 [Pluteus cervinus]